MVIHGCIDGYTRRIIYLNCANSNRATTVLQLFMEQVRITGLPQRVWADRGEENVQVANFMLHHPLREPGRGSFITGKSVHNHRIEQLWRDVFSQCLILFYQLFYFMADLEYLMKATCFAYIMCIYLEYTLPCKILKKDRITIHCHQREIYPQFNYGSMDWANSKFKF